MSDIVVFLTAQYEEEEEKKKETSCSIFLLDRYCEYDWTI
jgi:hypothetical protein